MHKSADRSLHHVHSSPHPMYFDFYSSPLPSHSPIIVIIMLKHHSHSCLFPELRPDGASPVLAHDLPGTGSIPCRGLMPIFIHTSTPPLITPRPLHPPRPSGCTLQTRTCCSCRASGRGPRSCTRHGLDGGGHVLGAGG